MWHSTSATIIVISPLCSNTYHLQRVFLIDGKRECHLTARTAGHQDEARC